MTDAEYLKKFADSVKGLIAWPVDGPNPIKEIHRIADRLDKLNADNETLIDTLRSVVNDNDKTIGSILSILDGVKE